MNFAIVGVMAADVSHMISARTIAYAADMASRTTAVAAEFRTSGQFSLRERWGYFDGRGAFDEVFRPAPVASAAALFP